jgi:hypothetical protein
VAGQQGGGAAGHQGGGAAGHHGGGAKSGGSGGSGGTGGSGGPVFRKSSKIAYSLGLFVLPVIVILVFYSVLHSQTEATLSVSSQLAAAYTVASRRSLQAEEVTLQLTASLLAEGYTFEVHSRLEELYAGLRELEYVNDVLALGFDAGSSPLLVGDQLDIPSPSIAVTSLNSDEGGGVTGMPPAQAEGIRQAVIVDACPLVVQAAATADNLTAAACATLANGVLMQGLRASTSALIAAGVQLGQQKYNVLQAARAAGSFVTPAFAATNFTATLETPAYRQVLALGSKRLPEAFQAIANQYSDAAHSQIVAFRAFVRTFAGAFLGLFSVAMLAVYRPLIQRLDEDVERKRALLLLLPPELLRGVPALKTLAGGLIAGALSNAAAASVGDKDRRMSLSTTNPL